MKFKLPISFAVVCFSLLACSTKPTKVSEEKFKEEISKIEEHYYNSATIHWKKAVTIKEHNSSDIQTTEEEETFFLRAATKEEVNPNEFPVGTTFHYGFVCEGRNIDVQSYIVPTTIWPTNHLLNSNYVLNFMEKK